MAERIVETMRQPVPLSSRAFVTIGASDLMRRADEALYRAKSAGKDRIAVV
ncbi:MAG TPA: hypothetical protein VMS32_02065 [Verrucomicrobiae bacterium]|jgi:GGDEF domain-containing protein|nr:hypothetical protein [Verrucomicrobiae bacterium]